MIPIVSILILTYNRVKLASKCIPQILDNIGSIENEVLILDNHSSDGTYDWLLEYKKADIRVTDAFTAKKNTGVEAINTLAKIAKGKYILKVDDDVNVPKNFAKQLVNAYEEVNEDKLLFLGWDFPWQGVKTFATRSGKSLYKGDRGKTIILPKGKVYINYTPSKWLINGVCRLSPRKKFLDMGGHPEGVVYGVDYLISKRAEEYGYWIGYYVPNNLKDLVQHLGNADTPEYRAFKDAQLYKHRCPKDW